MVTELPSFVETSQQPCYILHNTNKLSWKELLSIVELQFSFVTSSLEVTANSVLTTRIILNLNTTAGGKVLLIDYSFICCPDSSEISSLV
jgi:hypothetical protein